MSIKEGLLVQSTKGRDIGEIYMITRIDNKTLFLVNGKSRTFDKPKKKYDKHTDSLDVFVNLDEMKGSDFNAFVVYQITKFKKQRGKYV